jgi:phage shock protein PspC (stress-responsive transcriptional regulator)
MCAGVAGGMAEYFEIDPSLVRLIWVAAAVVSGGLAIPVYILAWIILPRDDRPAANGRVWRDWSQEFHNETQRLADEARRMADDVRGTGYAWRAPETPNPSPDDPATSKGSTPSPQPQPEDAWWRSDRYSERDVERHRGPGRNPRAMGILLVGVGALLLAANAGIFNWIEWRTMWPLIFIGLGAILLARQSGWNR